ncbi:hypothetical protein [Prosthecobacter sp.]|uniref:hypothetical protein n=1 Tax=Prosthecobacter sp. TaxID=1965333 RepID=UPI00378476DF
MSPAVLRLQRNMLLIIASLGMASCTSAPAPAPPAKPDKPAQKKDYSALRIGGRQELKLPGIGVIHADKREEIAGSEVLFTGRVFLEIPPSGDAGISGKTHYAYAEKARWRGTMGMLFLEGWSIIEFDRRVTENAAGSRVMFEKNGKITTVGNHETSFY